MTSAPRALVLIDRSVLEHPLMDCGRFLAALTECSHRARAVVVGAMTARGEEETAPLGVGATYDATHSGSQRTRTVLSGIDRDLYDAVVLVGWWVDHEVLDAYARLGLATEAFVGLDAVDEVQLAQACIGAAMYVQETLF